MGPKEGSCHYLLEEQQLLTLYNMLIPMLDERFLLRDIGYLPYSKEEWRGEAFNIY